MKISIQGHLARPLISLVITTFLVMGVPLKEESIVTGVVTNVVTTIDHMHRFFMEDPTV